MDIVGAGMPAELVLMEAFPELSGLRLNNREQEIIKRRFGLEGIEKHTFEVIGGYYRVTRERVRQIENRAIMKINLLLSGTEKPVAAEREISCQYVSEYKRIISDFQREDDILSHDDLCRIFRKDINSFRPGYLNLFMKTLGYDEMSSKPEKYKGCIKGCWYKNKQLSRKDENLLFSSLNEIFDTARRTSLFELTAKINKQISSEIKGKISNKTIKGLLLATEEMEGIEGNGDQYIMREFGSLPSIADKAYRILCIKNRKMHYREIAKEINKLSQGIKNINIRSMTGQMSSDERFHSIGKSGIWGLSDWNIDNVTIVEAMKNVFHKRGRPMNIDGLSEEIKTLRPASRNSLLIYLGDGSLFTKLGGGMFALKEWNMPSAASVRKRGVKRNRTKETLMDRVQKEILRVLDDEKGKSLRVIDVYKRVLTVMSCHQYTFYSYLDKMNNVKKFKRGTKFYVALDTAGRELQISD